MSVPESSTSHAAGGAGDVRLDGVKIAYLCLQATRQGQASYAHVHEIAHGLRTLGATVDLFEPSFVRDEVSPGAYGRYKEFMRVQDELDQQLKSKSYDLLYVRGHAFAWKSADTAHKRGIPVIQECNGLVDDFFIAWPKARLVAPLIRHLTLRQFRQATRVIAGSEGLADWIARECGRSADVVPNGANTKLFRRFAREDAESVFAQARKTLEAQKGSASSSGPTSLDQKTSFDSETLPEKLPGTYAIFFGSLAPWQGLETILDATEDPAWPNKVMLLVVGSGSKEALVKERARTSDTIVHLGSIAYEKLGPLVANSLCSLVIKEAREFSSAGISPLKLYESLACGVPVIATTDMPGLSDIVQRNKVGLLVPQHAPEEVAKAVCTLMAAPATVETLGETAFSYATKFCSWEARSKQTALVIRTALLR